MKYSEVHWFASFDLLLHHNHFYRGHLRNTGAAGGTAVACFLQASLRCALLADHNLHIHVGIKIKTVELRETALSAAGKIHKLGAGAD